MNQLSLKLSVYHYDNYFVHKIGYDYFLFACATIKQFNEGQVQNIRVTDRNIRMEFIQFKTYGSIC